MFDPLKMELTQLLSYRYEFAIPLSIQLLYEAICRFYAERRESPDYLFLAEEDLKRISNEPEAFLHRMVDPVRYGTFYIAQMASPVGGKPIHLIPMPNLPQRTAIFGFFGWGGGSVHLDSNPYYYYRQGPVVTTEEVEVPHVDQ